MRAGRQAAFSGFQRGRGEDGCEAKGGGLGGMRLLGAGERASAPLLQENEQPAETRCFSLWGEGGEPTNC